MTIRVIMNYHNNSAKKASVSRLDLHCQKMEFSITEQQIPMLLRLAVLLQILQTRQFSTPKEKSKKPIEERDSILQTNENQIIESTGESGWGMWAWNTMSSFLPMDWDNDWSSEQQLGYNGHVIHLGIFIDDATVTFKVNKYIN